MPSQDQWNERYRSEDRRALAPDPFLISSTEFWDLLPSPAGSRTAADLASGAGRHATYLASKGFDTTAIDFAPAGLELARVQASEQGVALTTRELDLESAEVDLGKACFDLLTVFNFLHRPLFDVLKTALKPDGLVIYKTYTVDQLALPGGPRSPAFVLQPNELRERFADYRVLRYEEQKDSEGTAAIVAQKP